MYFRCTATKYNFIYNVIEGWISPERSFAASRLRVRIIESSAEAESLRKRRGSQFGESCNVPLNVAVSLSRRTKFYAVTELFVSRLGRELESSPCESGENTIGKYLFQVFLSWSDGP